MKTVTFINKKISYFLLFLLFATMGCEREIGEDAVLATYATTAEIFIDAPIGMGSNFYFPYGPDATNPLGSKPTAWSIDNEVSYQGSASMRIDVPNSDDPEGNFAGAIFLIEGAGRDLSGYNALTFWAKASQGVALAEIGFGEAQFATKLTSLSMGTQWTKFIIPIPDPSRLTQERGMLFYSAGAINNLGYSFWLDEVKFENVGTIGQVRPFINGGTDASGVGFVGENLSISGVGVTSNLGNGRDVSVVTSPNYFSFSSTIPTVAATNLSQVSLVSEGTAVITANLGDIPASGSLTVSSVALAPTPTLDAADVIAVFSDAYTNSPVDYYNGYWAPFQKTQGQDDININGNHVIKYTNLNFVGIEFKGSKSIDATQMTHFHIDILLEDGLKSGDFLTLRLQDIGSDNAFGGFDPSGELRLTSTSNPALANGGWISVDVPFSRFPGLTSRANLAQVVFVSDETVKSIFVDNIYFHK